jgi:tetratricopeptide (TPR) repeat protein
MRITCPKCNSDFVLSSSQMDSTDLLSNCPFCDNEYRVIWQEDSSHPQVYFGTVSSRPKRICIECSKQFLSNDMTVIPICPECKSRRQVLESQSQKKIWKLSKGGRVIPLHSEKEVNEWIMQAAILPDDDLIDPEGISRAAKRYSNFSGSFRIQAQRSKVKTKSALHTSYRIFIKESAQKAALVLLGLAVLATLYRIAAFKPVGPEFSPDLTRFVEKLRDRLPPTIASAQELFRTALAAMAEDQLESYDNAILLLEQAAVNDPHSCPTLGTLAENYALSPRASTDPKFRLAATSLGGLVTKVCPDEIGGYVAKARAAILAKDYASAKQELDAATGVNPTAVRLLLAKQKYLLSSHKNVNELDEAIHAGKAAIGQDPNLLEAYDLMGQIYLQRSEPIEARGAFAKRLEFAAEDSKSLFRMGQIEELADNFRNAKEGYEQSLRQNPNMVGARLSLALLLLNKQKDTESAIHHLLEITTRYRKFATSDELFQAHLKLASLFNSQGKSAEALGTLSKIPVEFTTSEEAMVAEAESLKDSGRVQDAINKAKDIEMKYPASLPAKFLLATIHEKAKRIDEAVKAYRDAIKNDPSRLAPYLYLARALIENDREVEALDVTNAVISREEILETRDDVVGWKSFVASAKKLVSKQSSEALAHALLGFCLLKKGIDEEDRSALQSAVQSFIQMNANPKGRDYAPYYLGRTYYELLDYKKARTQLEEMIKSGAKSTASHYWLGMVELKTQRYQVAQAEFGKVIADPQWGYRALNGLGDLFVAQGKRDEARQHWRASLQAKPQFSPPFRSLLALKSN